VRDDFRSDESRLDLTQPNAVALKDKNFLEDGD